MGTPAVDGREDLVQIHWPSPYTKVTQVTEDSATFRIAWSLSEKNSKVR